MPKRLRAPISAPMKGPSSPGGMSQTKRGGYGRRPTEMEHWRWPSTRLCGWSHLLPPRRGQGAPGSPSRHLLPFFGGLWCPQTPLGAEGHLRSRPGVGSSRCHWHAAQCLCWGRLRAGLTSRGFTQIASFFIKQHQGFAIRWAGSEKQSDTAVNGEQASTTLSGGSTS